jgi:metal-responsive CopG/Arc/MetJ family transcriptional regulator
MPAKPIQISMDTDLLRLVDADQETRANGRSAFVRAAIEQYLAAKRRRRIESEIAAAYQDKADRMLADASDLLDAQAWPAD